MAQTLRPVSTSKILTEQHFSDQFARRSGIVFDTTGTGLRVTSDGSSTTVTVAAGQALIEGMSYTNDANVTVALGSLGTQPTSGQSRLSWIVVRLTKSGSPWSAAVTAITGTPGASPSTPSLGANDFPLALVTQSGTTAVTQAQIVDKRAWLTTGSLLTAAGDLPSSAPLGAVVRQSGRSLRRELVGGSAVTLGTPSWVSEGAVAESGVRSGDDTVPAGTTAAVASVSLANAGVDRQVLVVATLRYRQNSTSGNVTIWVTVDGVTVGTTGPFVEPASTEDQFVTIHGIGTSTSASPAVVLRASTSSGSLDVRTTSRVTATAL